MYNSRSVPRSINLLVFNSDREMSATAVDSILTERERKMIPESEVDSILKLLNEYIMNSHLDFREQLEYLFFKIRYMRRFLKVTEKKRHEHPELMKLVIQIKDVVSKAIRSQMFEAIARRGNHVDQSVKKEIESLTAEVKHIYDENMYDINGVAVKKLEHSSIGSGSTAGLGSSGVPRHIPKSGEEKVVVGFEEEVETLIQRLTDNRGEGLEIISIIGAAGGGKTTLAWEVYHHPFTSHTFQIRAWVTVSQSYDKNMKRNLLIRLLEYSKREDAKEESDTLEIHEDYEMSSEDSLGEKVLKCLKGRKYLIVMDDIWGIEAWNDIQKSFPKECRGSKVLFTSRFVVQPESVNFIHHYLAPLPTELSWELLEKKVFGTKDCPRELVSIGEQIAEKCKGLPLAIVAIAGILATKDKTLDVWEEVSKNVSSVVANENQESCMDILELSYNHLPHHLKVCFLYMGGFPEDLEIPTRELIWLWVKKGFIHQTEAGKSLEDIGKDYLSGLVDRNLIMLAKKSSSGRIKACRIHDLLRVLCLKKAEDDKFLEQIYNEGDSFSPFDGNMHHRLFSRPGSSFPSSLRLILFLIYAIVTSPFADHDSMIGRFIQKPIRLPEHSIYLPHDVFRMVELRHLHSKGRVFNYHLRKNFSLFYSNLDNLQTLHQICACIHCQNLLVKTPNLRKLGFHGCQKSQDGVLMIPDLEFLKFLEKLSITCKVEPVPSSSTLPPAALKFPPTITQLTLKDTRLKWEALSILQTLPNLEVLKLLRDACTGPVWNTNELEGSFQLKYLRFEFLDIEEWHASKDQFPRLEVLVLRYCSRLKAIPIDFADSNELRKIELHWCSTFAEKSAMEIQEKQRYTNGDDDCLNLTISGKHRETLLDLVGFGSRYGINLPIENIEEYEGHVWSIFCGPGIKKIEEYEEPDVMDETAEQLEGDVLSES